MNDILLEEELANLWARCDSIQADMADYMEANPKCDDQWTEERLRVLEGKVKELEDAKK